jgi:ABC-type cobalt transport system substrate-binding protein
MSLSGKLEIFPLEEVLRLLARSHQNGCLRVEGAGSGRVYMEGGSLTYATVEGDEAIRDHLLASGIASEDGLSRLDVSRGTLTEALAPSAASSALTDLIREQCVESIYRIQRPQSGHFEFLIDSRPRYATGQAFDVEMVIAEAERRAADWADIETVVPDLSTPWHMVPEIDEDSVNLSDSAWRFLAAMEGSCSVYDLAGRLGLTTFQTARRMAELSRARLVEAVAVPEAPRSTYESSYVGSIESVQHAITEPEPEQEPAYEPAYEPAAETEPVSEVDSQADRSWWGEATEDEVEEPAEPREDEPADGSFLETVFGELEKTEEASDDDDDDDDDPEDGGFGLLRRRGLGAAFRELADS